VIGISQSGETADTLAALREAKRRGARTLGLVNVVGSTIAREVDGGIYLHAGPEIGWRAPRRSPARSWRWRCDAENGPAARPLDPAGTRGRAGAGQAAGAGESRAHQAPQVEQIAERLVRAQNVLYLGRGYNFPVALEGALKLKESPISMPRAIRPPR